MAARRKEGRRQVRALVKSDVRSKALQTGKATLLGKLGCSAPGQIKQASAFRAELQQFVGACE